MCIKHLPQVRHISLVAVTAETRACFDGEKDDDEEEGGGHRC